jgi:hypothetical protein
MLSRIPLGPLLKRLPTEAARNSGHTGELRSLVKLDDDLAPDHAKGALTI